MANENVGDITCGYHQEPVPAFVRRDKRLKYYIYCPKCGISAPKAEIFQQFIKDNAIMYGAPSTEYKGGGKPFEPSSFPEAPEKQAEAIPETIPKNFTPAPEAIPKNQPKKVGSLMSGLMNVLGSEE